MADPWVAFSSGNPIIPSLGEGIVFPEKEDGEGVFQGCLFRNDKCKAKDLFSESRVRKEPVFVRVFVGSKAGIERWLQLSGPASCALWVEVIHEVKNNVQDSPESDVLTGQVKLAYRLRASAGCYISVLPDSNVALLAFHKIKPEAGAAPTRRWLVLMAARSFRHLLCMIEPGGVLAEFQIVLRQLVDSSNYLELALRHLDISGCLSQFPFLLTFEGVDLLVLTRDLKWTLLRFDCVEGKLKVSKGCSALENHREVDAERSFQGQDWQLWEEISMEKDARRIGTLGALVFNSFYVEGKGFVGGVSVQEYLDSLVNSWKEAGKKLKFMFSFPGVTVFELKSSNMFPGARLSTEEQASLSSLLSESLSARRHGLELLVELLLGGMSEIGGENLGDSGSSSIRGIVPSSRDSAINWCTFHEATSEGCFVSAKSSGSFSAQNPGWLKVLEWLERGFFNRLLEETLLLSECGGRGTSRVVEAFLKVIDIVPGDAISRIRIFFTTQLKELVSRVVGSSPSSEISAERNEHEIVEIQLDERVEERERVKREEKSRMLVCLCNVLAQVVHESPLAAAGIADAGVFTTLESFLELVQLALFKEASVESTPGCVLPGEVDDRVEFCSALLTSEAEVNRENELLSSPFGSGKMDAILQAQREEFVSFDQCTLRKSIQSRGFTKMLLQMILSRVGAGSSGVKGLSLAPESLRVRSSLKAARARKLMTSSPSKALLANAAAAKCHLLSATAAMLTTKSSSLKRIRNDLVQKLNEQQRRQLVGSFVEELMHSYSDGFPEKSHEHIIQILFILDKTEESIAESNDPELQVKAPRQRSRFPVLLLWEVQARLRVSLRSSSRKNLDSWITLGSLLQILSSFACKWPESGSAVLVFECCGGEVERILHLLSSAGVPALWGAGELLVMQNVLRLLATAMQSVHSPELDNHLWRTLAENNWDFIRSYSQWVVFDACHECVWELLEDSFWSIWEPLELPEPGSSFSSWLPRWLPSMQCEEIPLINLVSFLRLTIGLIERKLERRDDRLLPGKARVLLEFLMNPATGLLMKLLKGSGFCRRRMISRGEFAAAYFHVKHVREDLRGLIPYCTQRQGVRSQAPRSSLKVADFILTEPGSTKNPSSGGFRAAEAHQASQLPDLSFNLSYLAATNLEIASLQLLASIFTLSFQRPGVFPSRGNPFLSKVYSFPFLDFHFLRLRHLYYVNLFRGQKLRVGEPQLGKLSENSCTLEFFPDEQVPFPEAEIRDEQLSLECAVHVQVLLSLAQNQTEEITLRFKQLRVMDFLVHQIALEYEASQVATPRDVVRINKALAAQLKNSAKNSDGSPAESSLASSSITTPSLAGLKKGFCFNYSEMERRSHCLGVHRRTSVERKSFQVLAKSIPKLELGFLSARDAEKLEWLDSSTCESYLLSRPFTGRHEFLLKWQEMMKPFDRPPPELVSAAATPTATELSSFADVVEKDHLGEAPPVEKPKTPPEDEDGPREKLVYSGKFFDLNEEVERELAGEDEEDETGSSDDGSDESDRTSTGVEAGEEAGDDALFRPFVPKLNLPRSARKGDQEASAAAAAAAAPAAAPPPGGETKVEYSLENKSPGISLSVASTASWKRPESTTPYEMERSQRRLYRNPSLHLFLLELYITLMLTPHGTLDERYSDRFQTEKQKLNAPFFLFYHLNHVANSYLLPCLMEKMKSFHEAFRILKLSWKGLFDSSTYKNRIRIAHGAFAQIYKATLNTEAGPRLVVLKTVDFPKGPYEPCKFFDIYSEVQIMEKFVGEPRVCQLLDYGIESESFVLVLKHYKCSLRAWRLTQGAFFDSSSSSSTKGGPALLPPRKPSKSFFDRLPVYLAVYSAILDAVKVLERHNVVHYDLKCDNVLLEPNEFVSEEEFWDPTWPPSENSSSLPFKVCLADFGQSKASIFHGGECTFRNRGTEYVKSPEMLKLLQASSDVSVSQGDTRVGKAVDVWGLGCLFYELLAAEFLLYDEDWMRFFIRVTTHSEELITKEKAEKIGNFAPVIEFIRFILVRDPCRRPTIDEVIIHLRRLQGSLDKTKAKPGGDDATAAPAKPVTKPVSETGVRKPATAGVDEPWKPDDEAPVTPLKPSRLISSPGLASWLCCRCWGSREV